MICPGCGSAMEERSLEGTYGAKVTLDICGGCQSFWFDLRESLQLAPGSVLELFRMIHEAQGAPPVPQQTTKKCPRCASVLVETHDLQRITRFSYFRCPAGDGRLIGFFQFLKEKNLIKPLDPKQLAALRQQVKVINCSNCGAPVDLEKGAVCEHCDAPISMLDPNQVEATITQLSAAAAKGRAVDPQELAARVAMARAKTESFYARLDSEQPRFGRYGYSRAGLITWGLQALFDLVSR
jgi:Zn-finger nucleic acid-binding protein